MKRENEPSEHSGVMRSLRKMQPTPIDIVAVAIAKMLPGKFGKYAAIVVTVSLVALLTYIGAASEFGKFFQ